MLSFVLEGYQYTGKCQWLIGFVFVLFLMYHSYSEFNTSSCSRYFVLLYFQFLLPSSSTWESASGWVGTTECVKRLKTTSSKWEITALEIRIIF